MTLLIENVQVFERFSIKETLKIYVLLLDSFKR